MVSFRATGRKFKNQIDDSCVEIVIAFKVIRHKALFDGLCEYDFYHESILSLDGGELENENYIWKLFWKNIQFVCKICNCVYEVESREDFEVCFNTSYPYKHDFPYYSVICPNCKHEEHLGYDPKDLEGTDAANILCSWIPLLKERDDWNERFRVEPRPHDWNSERE